jgi:Na+-transporting methylmalonyl-CoA/oxaloacetate decarboxylase gamma subunit
MIFDVFPRLMFMGVGMLVFTVVLLTFLFAGLIVLKSLASNSRRDVIVDEREKSPRKRDAVAAYDLDDEELHHAEIIEEESHQSGA